MNSNLKNYGNIFKQEGTSRYERYSLALHPENILLDDRKLQDFIVYAQRYSRNVLFINTEPGNTETDLTENWEYFFKNDNIVLLIANIATKNVDEIKATYDFLSDKFLAEKTVENFSELVDLVFSRFKKINTWYYSSSSNDTLKKDLTLYIRSYLEKELQNLKEIVLYVSRRGKNSYTTQDFLIELFSKDIPELPEEKRTVLKEITGLLSWDNVWEIKISHGEDGDWEIKDKENSSVREHIFAGNDEEEKLANAALMLKKIFDAVFHATSTVVDNCQNYFNETINQKQDHPPHVAFMIAFIKLYGYVQDELNKIPQKHLSFYYKDVLQIKPRSAIPDQVYVVLELAKGFETWEIKKGTALSAGKDSRNNELIYETDEDFNINRAQVSSLNTIFIDKDKQGKTLNYYLETFTNNGESFISPPFVSSQTAPLPAGDNPENTTSWKTFGEKNPRAVSEVGFGIASTQFYLAKGERNVVITFTLHDDIANQEFDTSIIKLLLTGEKGWINSNLPESGIIINSLKSQDDRSIELNFSISISQELAIVAFNNKLHEGNFNTIFPVLQCILKYPQLPTAAGEEVPGDWETKINQLNTLQKIRIISTNIKVQVGSLQSPVSFDGVTDLILENHDSVIDNKKPFFPFTAIPKVGSSFYIGCKDLFYKPIQSITLNIEWMLPDNFTNYYQKYLPPYDSNKFTASLSILKNKRWRKIRDVSVIDIDTRDPKFRSIRLDFARLKLDEPAAEPEKGISSFDNTKNNGTLQLKLNYPDFGHGVYPQLITSAVMEKASSKSASVDYYKIVKRELNDSVISIKLPGDLDKRTGPLKVVVYDILENFPDDAQARTMMINGLSEMLRRFNGSNVISKKVRPSAAGEPPPPPDDGGRTVVNDENFIERILGFLKKIKLVDRDVHYDRNKQTEGDVVNEIKEQINTEADFIMPSDKDMLNIIVNETNKAITTTVINVVDQILAMRAIGPPSSTDIAALIVREFREANEVINDMIARKIAILLSANEIPPPPYTPLVNNISISYTSVKPSDVGGDQFFYITPFGVTEIDLLNNDKELVSNNGGDIVTNYIFPRSIINTRSGPDEIQGMLFIGFRNLVPDQNVSVLVQLLEGTKKNDKKPPDVIWWYLRNTDWIRLKDDDLVADKTYGLQTTGIITFSFPGDASNNAILFGQTSLFWLCAGVTTEPDNFPLLIDIKAQATVATFKNQDNDPKHLALPLEAGRIKTLVDKIPQVKAVSQPVSSFNGKIEELQPEYYTRVSERLRHKSRAINNWDYERLVLERFPSLYKVKCINNYYKGNFAAGHVTVVPVSDLRNKSYTGNNALIPKTNYIDLRKIEAFLLERCSPFVRVHAINPQLDHVLISCKVKFQRGLDKGFYLKKLNEELINFLTPWATGDMEAVSFSAKIFASSIITFIDKRKYVDYVSELVMRQYTLDENGEKVFFSDKDQLTSLVETVISTGHSILVSAPKHEIDVID